MTEPLSELRKALIATGSMGLFVVLLVLFTAPPSNPEDTRILCVVAGSLLFCILAAFLAVRD